MASVQELATRQHGGHGMSAQDPTDLVEGFSHLVLEVLDLDRSERWYRDILALDLCGRDLLAESAPHSVLRMATGQLLVLIKVDTPEPRRRNTSSIHHAFLLNMDEFQAAQERLAAAGYDIADDRQAFRARGEFSIDIYDPDDHRWQLQAYGPEAHAIITPGVGMVDCGPESQFADGSVTTFREGNFFLIRERAGFLALSRWCRHMNGLLSYQQEHWRFHCAFHGATYNLEGDHTGHMEGIPPLRLNPVTISSDKRVLVDTDTVVERSADEPPPFVACG